MDQREQLVEKIRAVIEGYLDDLEDLSELDTDNLAECIAAEIAPAT